MDNIVPREPTLEECSSAAFLGKDEYGRSLHAYWYPQMGGYVGRAVIVIPEQCKLDGCFDVWVWHDGNFPFSGDFYPDQSPKRLHHCSPDQFINFGQYVLKLQGAVPQTEVTLGEES